MSDLDAAMATLEALTATAVEAIEREVLQALRVLALAAPPTATRVVVAHSEQGDWHDFIDYADAQNNYLDFEETATQAQTRAVADAAMHLYQDFYLEPFIDNPATSPLAPTSFEPADPYHIGLSLEAINNATD